MRLQMSTLFVMLTRSRESCSARASHTLRSQQVANSGCHSNMIKLLVVLDPSRRKQPPDSDTRYPDWARREIPKADADSLLEDENLGGYIFEDMRRDDDR